MAGDPAGALVLLGMGIDALSMSPAALSRVKLVIRTFTAKQARALAVEALGLEDGKDVYSLLDTALGATGVLTTDNDERKSNQITSGPSRLGGLTGAGSLNMV